MGAPSRFRWVGEMSLAQLISWGTLFYTFSLLMPAIERELGLSRVLVSGAFSAALLASGLAGFPVGQLIERGHGRAVMAGGSLAAGLLLGAHSLVGGAVGLYAVWIGLGVAMACTLYEPGFAILIRRWPSDYRRALIAMTFLGGLASTVFVPLSALLIERLGWRDASLVLAALHLAVCLPIHVRMLGDEPRRVPRTQQAVGERDRSLIALALSPAFLLITVFVASIALITSAMTAHMVPLLRERGLPEAWAVAVPASIGALQVIGRLALFLVEKRIEPRHLDRFVPLLLPLAIGLLIAGGASIHVAFAFAACYGIGNGLTTIVKATAIAQYVSRERLAPLSGLQALPNAIARSVGPILMAALWSLTGDYAVGLWALLLLGVVATLLLRLAQANALDQP